MPSIKNFTVFGDRVDVFVDSATSNGHSSTFVEEVKPGEGHRRTVTPKKMRPSSLWMAASNFF